MNSRITAFLGPTNTGKTYTALERLAAMNSGAMGFPLRLMARENYDRLVQLKGAASVALLTGEEKIIPPTARYFATTMEALPYDMIQRQQLDVVVLDEVQMAGDYDRGHVFTECLLSMRGKVETWLLGGATMTEMVRQLIPDAMIETRTRLSPLTYAGVKKLQRLPKRTAVVAFSMHELYHAAENIRRNYGGTALVMGALSPHVRAEQVKLFQNGDVDYLVATDAIGMGLNLDIDHVHLVSLNKFDGQRQRRLTNAEIAQIVGRAGRYQRPGSFSVSPEVTELSTEDVEEITQHQFAPVDKLYWRSPKLRFNSIESLLSDLATNPPDSRFRRKADADDHKALQALTERAEIMRLVQTADDVRLLWQVCQIPDYANTYAAEQYRRLEQMYQLLHAHADGLGDDMMQQQLAVFERIPGDMGMLLHRQQLIRFWRYVTANTQWVKNASLWYAHTEDLETKLSAALHEALSARYVDRVTRQLMQQFATGRDDGGGETTFTGESIQWQGDRLFIDGREVGQIEGLTFKFHDPATSRNIPKQLIQPIIDQKIKAAHEQFVVDAMVADQPLIQLLPNGELLWRGVKIARLSAGVDVLNPDVVLRDLDHLTEAQKQEILSYLKRHVRRHLQPHLKQLWALQQSIDSEPNAGSRAIRFALLECLGYVRTEKVAPFLQALSAEDKQKLTAMGVRFGEQFIYMPELSKGPTKTLMHMLMMVEQGQPLDQPMQNWPAMIEVDAGTSPHALLQLGYDVRKLQHKAYAIDVLERLADYIRPMHDKGAFIATHALLKTVNYEMPILIDLMAELGYSAEQDAMGVRFAKDANAMRKLAEKQRQQKNQLKDKPLDLQKQN